MATKPKRGPIQTTIIAFGSKNSDDLSMFEGIQNNDVALVKSMLDRGVSANLSIRIMLFSEQHRETDPSPMSILCLAVMHRRKRIVDLLIEHGADVNYVRQSDNTSVLHYAAMAGKVRMIQSLMNAGANVAAKNGNDKTPLEVCGYELCREVLRGSGCATKGARQKLD